jgi:hypothetical protein
VAGYLFRARQEQRRQPREQALEPPEGSENRERLGEEARQGSDPVPRDGADTPVSERRISRGRLPTRHILRHILGSPSRSVHAIRE